MDEIKDAFGRVKEDVYSLYENMAFLNESLSQIKEELSEIKAILIQKRVEESSTRKAENRAVRHINSTDNGLFSPLKPQNLDISTGNGGVSTDRQTLRQTDKYAQKENFEQESPFNQNTVDEAAKILDSLDNIKKEIRLKFKQLTDQEILVFSTLYQIEEEQGYASYNTISLRTGLSESSIRDYVSRIIKKGIPVDKLKINNKMIHLKISPNLKKIASLQTILDLRGL